MGDFAYKSSLPTAHRYKNPHTRKRIKSFENIFARLRFEKNFSAYGAKYGIESKPTFSSYL